MLEEKIVALTTEVVALRKAIEAGGTAKPAAAAAKAGTAAAKTPPKKKVVEPDHDADETGAIFRKAAKEDKPACRKYLKSVGCADLAELLTKPELFDGAYEAAEAILGGEEEAAEDDDEV